MAGPLLTFLAQVFIAMRLCDDSECLSCSVVEGDPACLRRRARLCMWLSEQSGNTGARAALEKLSFGLMEEACTIEKELAAVIEL